MNKSNLRLRPITDKDKPFLCKLYHSTRLEEMAQSGWDDQQIANFLDFQFEAQHKHYQDTYYTAAFDIIEQDKIPVGRLYVDRRNDELRIVDIALMPETRGKGIGSHYLQMLLKEAGQDKAVRIHVEHNNPAMTLYKRLGFKKIDTNGVYHLMEWRKV